MSRFILMLFGATNDERIVNLVLWILAAAMPSLFAGAMAGMPVPQ